MGSYRNINVLGNYDYKFDLRMGLVTGLERGFEVCVRE